MNVKKIRISGFMLKVITALLSALWVIGNAFTDIDESIRLLMVVIGMIYYPFAAFFISEGFLHSSSLKKYIIRLAVLAVVAEPFYDFAMNKFEAPKMFYSQNIVFTLLIGLIGLYFYDLILTRYKENKLKMNVLRILVMLLSCIISVIIGSEFTYYGILMIFIMYIFKKDRISMLIAIMAQIIFIGYDLMMYLQLLALPFLFLYKGQEGKKAQKVFYAFYPALLVLVGAIHKIVTNFID